MRFPSLPSPPPPLIEIAIWLALAALAVGLRLFVAAHLPTYVWTRDSGSYIAPAIDWLETGRWVTNPRRGPLYSLLIAWILKAGGNFASVVQFQALLGFLTACLTVGAARWRLGRAAFWPVAICALFYAAYPMPINLERLIRNETMLVFFATVCFGAWRVALDVGRPTQQRVAWTLLSGLAGGCMHALKGIFPVLPLLVVAALGWQNRRRPATAALLAVCFVLPFFAPKAASKLYDRASGTVRPPEPEDGIMFYGRTAQWTQLDGGFEPGVKAQVRGQVEAYMERYRRTGKLDNNEIIKRTVVPSLKGILQASRPGFSPTDLNRFCWRLGAEAAWNHPGAYAWQMVRDFCYLNFISAHRFESFWRDELKAASRDASAYFASHYDSTSSAAGKAFGLAEMQAAIRLSVERRALAPYERWNDFWRHVRVVSPVFLTSLLLPVLCYNSRRGERLFWGSMGALWFYYLVLLSTVGRPLDRYLMPVVPLVFWTLSTALALGWRKLAEIISRRDAEAQR